MAGLPNFLSQLIGMAPALLVYLVGCVLAFSAYSKCRRAATFLLIGLAILIATRLSWPLMIWLATDVLANNDPQMPRHTVMSAVSILSGLMHTVGVAFLIAAALVDRAPRDSAWIDDEPSR